MIAKPLVPALGIVLALGGTSLAHAVVYTSTANNFAGNFAITGFADATPDTYQIALSGLTGVLDLNVPHGGIMQAERMGTVNIDYIPAHPGPELVSVVPSFITLGVGNITTTGITGTHFIYDFDTNTFTSDGIPVTGGAFGGSASVLSLFLGNIFGPLGPMIGTGSLSVTHVLGGSPGAGTWTIDITESDAGGTGFSGLFAALDTLPPGNPLNLPAGNSDGRIDGTFDVNAAVRLTVPEPATMALLGIGLVGLAAARRRKAG